MRCLDRTFLPCFRSPFELLYLPRVPHTPVMYWQSLLPNRLMIIRRSSSPFILLCSRPTVHSFLASQLRTKRRLSNHCIFQSCRCRSHPPPPSKSCIHSCIPIVLTRSLKAFSPCLLASLTLYPTRPSRRLSHRVLRCTNWLPISARLRPGISTP